MNCCSAQAATENRRFERAPSPLCVNDKCHTRNVANVALVWYLVPEGSSPSVNACPKQAEFCDIWIVLLSDQVLTTKAEHTGRIQARQWLDKVTIHTKAGGELGRSVVGRHGPTNLVSRVLLFKSSSWYY